MATALAVGGVVWAQQMISLDHQQTYTWVATARGESRLPGCRLGYYARQGGLVINYHGGDQRLVFRARSNGDPVMCVTSPNGSFFNDDTNGLNPMITIRNPRPGMYTVRVGTYEQGRNVRTNILISP